MAGRPATTEAGSSAVTGIPRRARSVFLIRAVWVAVLGLTVLVFLASLPGFAAQMRTPCVGVSCERTQLTPEAARALHDLGLSLGFYAAYSIVVNTVFVLGYSALGAMLIWRRPDERIAVFGAFMLVLFGWTFNDPVHALSMTDSAWWWPVTVLSFLGSASMFTFFYLFPDGRFVPRWTRWAAVAWVALNLLGYFSPSSWVLNQSNGPYFLVLVIGFFGSVTVAQFHRYRRVSTAAQRQQTKWVIYGFAAALIGFFIDVLILQPHLLAPHPGDIVARLIVFASFGVFLLLIPLSLGIAILRYRLWDIDLLINRTLVYAVLTASVIGLYILIVGYLSAVFRTEGNLAISLVATGLIAVLFHPLREYLQRWVNRLVYGERDDPYAILSRLGQRLEGTLAADAVLPTIVQTVAEALKLPYVAITLRGETGFAVAATYGTAVATLMRLPLVYRQETIGELLLATRAPNEVFSPADRRLLDDLARQAGAAAHSVRMTTELRQLTADLQGSRERLVTAREEERRRLRRDLHDGLGPALGGLSLKLEIAHDLVLSNPIAATDLLVQLQEQTQAAVADIRRLVYALRPPALDELGLVAALRETVARYEYHGNGGRGPDISIDAPEQLPPLPAAVEVAVYRIIQEALTNVVRHATARTCVIRLSLDEIANMLDVEVRDDGRGLLEAPVGSPRRVGVGLSSMRERAAELGGTCTFESPAEGGFRVRARLPYAALGG